MLYYILGCSPPLPPTFVPSHQCMLLTLFSYILPSKFPHLCPSTKGRGKGSEGEQRWYVKGVKGSEGRSRYSRSKGSESVNP